MYPSSFAHTCMREASVTETIIVSSDATRYSIPSNTSTKSPGCTRIESAISLFTLTTYLSGDQVSWISVSILMKSVPLSVTLTSCTVPVKNTFEASIIFSFPAGAKAFQKIKEGTPAHFSFSNCTFFNYPLIN